MADTPDYTKLNPKAIIGTGTEPDPDRGLVVNIFNEDGSPNYFVEPTKEESLAYLEKFIDISVGIDMRALLFMLGSITDTVKNAVFSTMQAAHHVAHNPEYNQGYDEDTLCKGVNSYLMTADEAAEEKGHPDGENIVDFSRFSPKGKPH